MLFFLVQKAVTLAPTAIEAAKKSEAIVVATEWKEFREIDWKAIYDTMKKPAFVFDGRLILDAPKLRSIGFRVSIHTINLPDMKWLMCFGFVG
jgi:UDPglucose 6-dehydrogenase